MTTADVGSGELIPNTVVVAHYRVFRDASPDELYEEIERRIKGLIESDNPILLRHAALCIAGVAAVGIERSLTPISLKDYYSTKKWKRIRSEALQRAGGCCQLCNASERIQVHHRTYDRLGREKPDDLIVLCRRCHARHHEVLA